LKKRYNYGLIDQWTLNNTLLDSVRCNELAQYTNATFSLESGLPIIYSGTLQSNGYFSAPSDIYFTGDFTITALVNVISTQNWARLIDVQFYFQLFFILGKKNLKINNLMKYISINKQISNHTMISVF
jgi:hypothetical protein